MRTFTSKSGLAVRPLLAVELTCLHLLFSFALAEPPDLLSRAHQRLQAMETSHVADEGAESPSAGTPIRRFQWDTDVIALQFTDPRLEQPPGVQSGADSPPAMIPFPPEPIPAGDGDELDSGNVLPIDLPTALRLAGANNLQIAIARERVNEAAAQELQARALWVPSLNAGVVYNNHSGRLQATEGEILEVSRSSLFTGAAAVVGNSPATGGAGGPRMFVDLSLADAIFEPLAARQIVRATVADRATTFNDTLLEVAATYLALVRAHMQVEIAEEAVRNADELVRITSDFAEAGEGLQADADRARVEADARRRDVLEVREQLAVLSAELARLLRLDPTVQLRVAEQAPAKLDFVDPELSLEILIGQALAARPEIRTADAQLDATYFQQRKEELRPWIPHLYAGASGGGFGGGEGSDINSFSGRSDVDIAAIWQFQNLGIGNLGRTREQSSNNRQARLALQQIREIVAAEVAQSQQRVQLRGRQIEVVRPQVESAIQALRRNLEGIRGGELRPIEIQQAIGALAASRTQYLNAVIGYNTAQVQLVRAIGQPPAATAQP